MFISERQMAMSDTNFLRIPRSATKQGNEGERESRTLQQWRDLDAYVLLGDPGAGKSVSFEEEAKACGGQLVTARDFIAGIEPDEADGRIIFIDGLDEVRAGQQNGWVPFEDLRKRLKDLGRPRFRLSCREADWLGQSDKSNLAKVAPGQRLEVLHLDPLRQEEIVKVLHSRSAEVPDPTDFWGRAERFGLTAMFGNPLLLDLTIKAVAGGRWPSTRRDIYEASCRRLATEFSPGHQEVKPLNPGEIDRLLDDAGLLCVVLLLSNQAAWTTRPENIPGVVQLSDIPDVLPMHDARAALATKVFTTTAGHSIPRHRSIAEYLGAKALARKIRDGLPLGRVLALMQGFDGRPVEPLRGLFAWLVVHHAADRQRLIQLDPLGIVLNGDAGALSITERIELLDTLKSLAEQDPWFRQNSWVSHPFGPLATAEMAAKYDELLSSSARGDKYQVFIDCVLDALQHGEIMPTLASTLETWITDEAAWVGNRLAAYEAWKLHAGFDANKASQWLDDQFASNQADSDRLANALLEDLYPKHIQPDQIFNYLRISPQVGKRIIGYPYFWKHLLLTQTDPKDTPILADNWPSNPISGQSQHDRSKLGSALLTAALRNADSNISDERLYAWLGIPLDDFGDSALDQDFQEEVSKWLEARPDRMKSIVAHGFRTLCPDEHGARFFSKAEWRLHGATLPRDWINWLLEQASGLNDEELVCYCFQRAAAAAIEKPELFNNPSMEEIERWTLDHINKWPQASEWLEKTWSTPLDPVRSRLYLRRKKAKTEQEQARNARQEQLQRFRGAFAAGTAPVHLTYELAQALNGNILEIPGKTPLERAQNYLVCDQSTAAAAIAGIAHLLERSDLPTIDQILALARKESTHLLTPGILLAARYIHEKDPAILQKWPDELIKLAYCCRLTYGIQDAPEWYKEIIRQKPELVASVFLKFATPVLRHKENVHITDLWLITQDKSLARFSKIILPTLLEAFPFRSSAASRDILNEHLLANLHTLDSGRVTAIIQQRVRQKGLDAAQRICWLTAALAYLPDSVTLLSHCVGSNSQRLALMAEAIRKQKIIKRALHHIDSSTISKLISLLASITPISASTVNGAVSQANRRAETIKLLINLLANNPKTEAHTELITLLHIPSTKRWENHIFYAIRTQRAIAREAAFQAAEPKEVAATLANTTPASTVDLQALLTAHLHDLEAHLRGRNTYLLKQYWSTTKPAKPLGENECRDLLLDKLSDKLSPLAVHVEREASAANDKRADMRANFMRKGRRLAVPIEVKKDNHPKLWTAWDDQLKTLYTNDPDTDGIGIYLVLWFNHDTKPSPEGIKPKSAAELQDMLMQRIPLEDRAKLAVKVMDLSMQKR